MRNYIRLTILLLCLHIAARGQTIVSLDDIDLSGLPQSTEAKALRYWFDDDNGSVQTVSTLSGTHTLDVSALSEGMHTLHYQVIGTDDAVAYIGGGVFMKAPSGAGLSVKSMRYWFDDDAASVQTAGGITGAYVLDVSRLSDGLHTLHYQLMGEGGTAGYVGSSLFMNTGSSFGTETVKVQKLMYWYDDDTTTHVADLGSGPQLIDASGLTTGLHTIHYQALCTNGLMTPAKSSFFVLLGIGSDGVVATSLRYWFDDVPTASEIEITEGVQLLDASALNDGLHTVHYQIVDSKRTLGTPCSAFFLKMGVDTENTTAKQLRYWFDDDNSTLMLATVDGATQTLDASALSDGLHTVHYFIVDSKGLAAVPRSAIFMKMNLDDASTAKQLRYWFDDEPSAATVTTVAAGTQTLDVAALPTGLHTLSYQLIDSKGQVGTPSTRIFLKNFEKVLPDGHNRVMKYQYWQNQNSQAMQTVELAEAANPYTLTALLPMQKEPIQSSQFHFDVTNDVPTIYAKNTLHVRFYDAQNYFTDGDRLFVDYSVKQEVEPVGELQTTQTFDKVAENDIRWYTMQVAPGDTAAFRVSQPATVQVFAPSGKEVFKTSESASVNWSGIHTWEDGTYYVAVHDVTGSRNTMTLEYMHMDKYDVVDWDVHTVGNGGCSTITFKGNGFRDLYSVELFTEEGDKILSENINYTSDASVSIRFNFTAASLGVYDAMFHFTEGDKFLDACVTVEEAEEIELIENVVYASSFLRGTSNTYTIKIENKGNSTAYQVPLKIQLQADGGLDDITYIKLSDNLSSPEFEWLNDEAISKENRDELKALIDSKGDYLDFFMVRDTIENEEFMEGYFAINLPPKSTSVFTITVKSNSRVNVYTLLPDDWDFFAYDSQPSKQQHRIMRKDVKEGMCCARQHVECAMNLVATVLDYGSVLGGGWAVASCIASVGNTIIPFAYDIWCGETPKDKDEAMKSLYKNIASSLISCVGKLDPYKMGWMIQHVNDVITTSVSCLSHPKQIPNCPPKPPKPHSSDPRPPVDPNDIYGYSSNAGSKYIADYVEKVCYTIEFENDTTFAEASAHTIVIKDTLDSRYFDLRSFLPTSIKLGSHETQLDEGDMNNSNGVTKLLKTIDMRPEINAIAQVEGTYSRQTGIAEWRFTSLDPMTMEPTDDLMQGILPVNYDGTSGIGEVMYEIGVKPNKADGTEISNRASIVFDYEDAILTPTWTNIVDATAPESQIVDVQMATDSTAAVRIEAHDELSGPWRYDVYVQYGSGAWFEGAKNVPIDSVAQVKVYEGIDHGFYVVVTDSAGNVERKEAAREFTFEVFGSQVDTDTRIELAEGWNWMSHNQQEPLLVADITTAAARMVGQTEETVEDSRLGWMGDLTELLPTQMYKLQMDSPRTLQLSGRLFNAGFRSLPYYEGWNWMGYPLAHVMTPGEALARMEAEEGDFLVGQDGMATYADGQWTGTLQEMVPGQGYMLRSAHGGNLFYNATAQASARRANGARTGLKAAGLPEGWAVDKHRYPSVMGIVAQLWQGNVMAPADDWLLGAFSGNECRGVAQVVGGSPSAQAVLMMNVYGTGSEPISFVAMNRQTGELLAVQELEEFRADVVGTLQQPLQLHMGEATGIAGAAMRLQPAGAEVYDLQGRRVDAGQMQKGVYVVTDGSKTRTQKVVRR